jgi:hypothetical protein
MLSKIKRIIRWQTKAFTPTTSKGFNIVRCWPIRLDVILL